MRERWSFTGNSRARTQLVEAFYRGLRSTFETRNFSLTRARNRLRYSEMLGETLTFLGGNNSAWNESILPRSMNDGAVSARCRVASWRSAIPYKNKYVHVTCALARQYRTVCNFPTSLSLFVPLNQSGIKLYREQVKKNGTIWHLSGCPTFFVVDEMCLLTRLLSHRYCSHKMHIDRYYFCLIECRVQLDESWSKYEKETIVW